MLLAETIELIEQLKDGDIDIIECGIEIGYRERMYYVQFGMFNITPIKNKNLKRLHSMAFGFHRITDDIYKCIPTPGQLFTNIYCEAHGLGTVAGGGRRCEEDHHALASGLRLLPSIAEEGHWRSHRGKHQTTQSGGVFVTV